MKCTHRIFLIAKPITYTCIPELMSDKMFISAITPDPGLGLGASSPPPGTMFPIQCRVQDNNDDNLRCDYSDIYIVPSHLSRLAEATQMRRHKIHKTAQDTFQEKPLRYTLSQTIIKYLLLSGALKIL